MADNVAAGTSGVPPSPSVTTGVAAAPGSRSRYSAITPRHCAAAGRRATGPDSTEPGVTGPDVTGPDSTVLDTTGRGGEFTQCLPLACGAPGGAPAARSFPVLRFHPHHAVDSPHRLHRGQVGHGRGERGLSCPV